MKLLIRGIGHHCFTELSWPIKEKNWVKEYVINTGLLVYLDIKRRDPQPSLTITWYSSVTGAEVGVQ